VSVQITVEQRVAGRRVKGKCVRPTRKNRRAKGCRRFVTRKGSFRLSGKQGANSFRFSGRMRGKRLPRGTYRLVATPANTPKKASDSRRAGFVIKAPAKRRR
jgi:hypothetical protein